MHTFIRRIAVPAAALAFSTAAPANAQPADASALSGRWTGTYDCAQGATALDLDLRGNAHGIVQGTFRFSPTHENPEVPAGGYPVMGRFTGASLVLRPIDARDLPTDYVPVGIQATVDGRRMTGWIEGPGCGALMLTRAETAPSDAPLPGGYGGQRWQMAVEGETGRLFVDRRARLDPDARMPRAWMRWEVLRDDAETGARAGMMTEMDVEVDCRAGRVRVWNTLEYGADGALVAVDGSPPYAWQPIIRDSMYDFVAEHACGPEAPGTAPKS